jgi:photosystem II stability/assembly factor-like uncharacterized protein
MRTAILMIGLGAMALAAASGCASGPSADRRDSGRVSRQLPYWYLTSVDFTDKQHGWAVGGVGGILVRTAVVFATKDGGRSWHAQEVPYRLALRDVDFVHPRLGLAVGGDGAILRSTDGQTWHELSSGTTNALYAAELLDARVGWAVGDGVLLQTTGAGETWQKRRHPTTGVQFTDVSFADALHGWVVGGSTISHGNWGATLLATEDGGESWLEQAVPTKQALYAVHFVDRQRGWIVGNHGVILHTLDGGASWPVQRAADNRGPGFLRGVRFVDSRRGWAVGGRGRASRIPVVLQTRDGGRSWHHAYCFERTFLCSVAALDRRHVWVVGNNYRLLRSSGWNDWIGPAVSPAPTQAPVAASGDGRANTRAPSSLSIW